MHSLLADPNSDYVNANYIDVSSFLVYSILYTIPFLSSLQYFSGISFWLPLRNFMLLLCDFAQEAQQH